MTFVWNATETIPDRVSSLFLELSALHLGLAWAVNLLPDFQEEEA